ncbi:Mrp family chromosome partitioning ATPase/predicted Fe-Mo cluster-binding NifX family protein [Desulfobaculum xiamenense]|uniref:Iron-sulfur cluster carrier protein n=1 Tax=Desulfobaculum xiamenense TaxID=995050 RepID=A0A846QPB5_9BACT|nr:iron-sulfur cluster carrier protein MrpORP [Desulfobaculum xiamenense]NJB66549.1 Mrp family chromosome partitioning ATPase/predicted Fe-Mo cluster-binding NifX family protein [Desulfobaculum xiamenense]
MSECGSCSGGNCSGGSCQENPQDLKIKKALGKIKHKIVVMSGKGGVGKSTVATNIAVALSMAGMKVGLLDVDVHGPSVPRLLSLQDEKPHMERDCMEPIAWSRNLGVMSLGFLLPSKEDAVIWRGPVKIGLIRQFISDVTWGDLDFLIIDCPPGTGDEPLSALQELGPDAKAVIVTTPQGVAIDDVRRSVTFCNQVGNEIFGIIENMSGFVCSKCGSVENVFGVGGGEKLAQETGVRFLGRIPMHADVARSGEEGFPIMKLGDHSPAGEALNHIIKPLLDLAGRLQEQQDTSKPVDGALSGDNGTTRVAVPVAAGQLCQHFGHCEKFALLDVDNATRTITKGELLTPPPHEPGVLPRWLAEKGAKLIIAGGMGARAQSLFTESGIKVVVGAQGGDPETIVNAYLAGQLTVGQNICDH